MNLDRLKILAEHFEELGDYAMAESITIQILALKQREYGPHAPELLPEIYNLALLQEVQDDCDKALSNAQLAYAIARANRTETSVDLFEIKGMLSRLTGPMVA